MTDYSTDASTIKTALDAVYAKKTDKNVFYGTCSTGASTQTKTVTADGWSFTTGNILFVNFTNGNTYNGTAQIKIGSTTKSIVSVGTTTTSRYYWKSGELVGFVYDGTNMLMLEQGTSSTTYYGVTKLSSSTSSTSETLAATPAAVKAAYDLANGKLSSSDVGAAAISNSYEDLNNKPTIPSKISDLTNDSDFIETSSTSGLIKNDGTVMTGGTGSSNYAIGNHTHSGYVSATKVTSWQSTPSDSNVPSEKLVKDTIDSLVGDARIMIVPGRKYVTSAEETDVVVKLTNSLGQALSGESVTVYDGTTTYNGTTDTNGEYRLFDVNVLTDTTFTATYGTVTATCTVEKCLFVDYAVTSNHNTNYTVGSAITKTVGGNYTTLSATNANSTYGRTYSTSSFSGNLTLEMEVNMVDYASNWAFYLGFRNGSNHSIARLLVGGWRYIKFTREDGVCKGYISTDNNTWSEMSMYSDDVGSSDVQLELYIYNTTGTSHSVQFKNVRIKAL